MIKEDSLGVTNEADSLLFQNSKMEQEAGSTKIGRASCRERV